MWYCLIQMTYLFYVAFLTVQYFRGSFKWGGNNGGELRYNDKIMIINYNNLDPIIIWDLFVIGQCGELHTFNAWGHHQVFLLLLFFKKSKNFLYLRCEELRRWHFTNDSSKKLTKMDALPLLMAPEKHGALKMTLELGKELCLLLFPEKKCYIP